MNLDIAHLRGRLYSELRTLYIWIRVSTWVLRCLNCDAPSSHLQLIWINFPKCLDVSWLQNSRYKQLHTLAKPRCKLDSLDAFLLTWSQDLKQTEQINVWNTLNQYFRIQRNKFYQKLLGKVWTLFRQLSCFNKVYLSSASGNLEVCRLDKTCFIPYLHILCLNGLGTLHIN